MLPSEVVGPTGPAGRWIPTKLLYIHSHTNVYANFLVPRTVPTSDMAYIAFRREAPAPDPGRRVQGLPLIKPPYDQITAYNMNTGDIVWQKTHSSTPDDIKNHPLMKGLDLPRLGQPGRTFIGVLTTKNLLIAGEGGVHSNAAGRRVALLRAYDKLTGADVGAVEMPNKQTGSPMSYQIDGKQFIVLAVSGNDGAEIGVRSPCIIPRGGGFHPEGRVESLVIGVCMARLQWPSSRDCVLVIDRIERPTPN